MTPMSFLVHENRPIDDPIFSLNHEAVERIARGDSIVNATIGVLLHDDGSLVVLPTVADAVLHVDAKQWASYAPIAGLPDYLKAVCDEVFGPPGTESPLRDWATAVATPGGSGALRIAYTSFLSRGQSALTTSFFWGPYGTLAEESDRGLRTFAMFATPEARALDLVSFERELSELLSKQGRALILLNDPCHNPTGYSMSEGDWSGVTDVLDRQASAGKIALLLDSAYCAYASGGLTRPLSHLGRVAEKVQLLVAWSASKSFAQYGLRTGALLALVPDKSERTKTQAAFSYACRGTWSNCNRGGMVAIERLLREPRLREKVALERREMVALLSDRVKLFNALAVEAGLRYPRYEGGFFVTVFTDRAFEACERMKGLGVFVVPQEGAIRLALSAVQSRDIPRLVDAVAASV